MDSINTLKMQKFIIYFMFTLTMQLLVLGEPVTENSLNSNYVFDNKLEKDLENTVDKPSKLRMFLLADLARTSDLKSFITSCDHSVDLSITTKNCTCANFLCLRYHKASKKSRIFDRSCEDVCCGKKSKGKSLENLSSEDTNEKNKGIMCGEMMKTDNDMHLIPWTVNLVTKGGKLCLGTLLSNNSIITHTNCAERGNLTLIKKTVQSTSRTVVKIKEILTNDGLQNSAILILSQPFDDVPLHHGPCIPQSSIPTDFSNCYIGSRNGYGVKAETAECSSKGVENPNETRICAQTKHIDNSEITVGAPLLCSLGGDYEKNFQIVGTYFKNDGDIYIFSNLYQIRSVISKYFYTLM